MTLQRRYGNQAVQRLLAPSTLQGKPPGGLAASQGAATPVLVQRQASNVIQRARRKKKKPSFVGKVASGTVKAGVVGGELADMGSAGIGLAEQLKYVNKDVLPGSKLGMAGGTVGGVKDLVESYKSFSDGEKGEGAVKGLGGVMGLASTLAGAKSYEGTAKGLDLASSVVKGGYGGVTAWQAWNSQSEATALASQSASPVIQEAAKKLSTIARYRRNMAGWDAGTNALGATSAATGLLGGEDGISPYVSVGTGLASKVLGAETTWSVLSTLTKGMVWTNKKYEDEISKLSAELTAQAVEVITALAVSPHSEAQTLYRVASAVAGDFAKTFKEKIDAGVDRSSLSPKRKAAAKQRLHRLKP
jgi:hypothetical protein